MRHTAARSREGLHKALLNTRFVKLPRGVDAASFPSRQPDQFHPVRRVSTNVTATCVSVNPSFPTSAAPDRSELVEYTRFILPRQE
jgi:hypothetical protein